MIGKPRLRVVSTGVVLCVAATVGLAGCASPVDSTASSSWVDPPWVAEQAAQHEEYRAKLQSCLDGMGWDVTVDSTTGGVVDPLTNEELSRFLPDVATCRVSMGLSADGELATLDELKVIYTELLDTRDCFVAHGVEGMAPPQSEDAWLDAEQSTDPDVWMWHPYTDPAFTALTMDEQDALEVLCPQPWSTK